MKEVPFTPEGYAKLQEEIEYLSTTKRREVAERIKHAREFGDNSENSEYDDAQNEQAMLEQRIAVLEERLASARIIDVDEVTADVVGIGTRVKLKDMKERKRKQMEIEDDLRERLARIPGLTVTMMQPNLFGSAGDIVVEIYGHDFDEARELGLR